MQPLEYPKSNTRTTHPDAHAPTPKDPLTRPRTPGQIGHADRQIRNDQSPPARWKNRISTPKHSTRTPYRQRSARKSVFDAIGTRKQKRSLPHRFEKPSCYKRRQHTYLIDAQRQTLLEAPTRLPLEPVEELLANLTGARFNETLASLGRSSPVTAIVVRRAGPFIIGAVRGLRTLFFQSASRSLFTIRRAALAEKREFSLGGLHVDAAVGLRRR
jgi:hypothetical protein